jgi:hypothetical protein
LTSSYSTSLIDDALAACWFFSMIIIKEAMEKSNRNNNKIAIIRPKEKTS